MKKSEDLKDENETEGVKRQNTKEVQLTNHLKLHKREGGQRIKDKNKDEKMKE